MSPHTSVDLKDLIERKKVQGLIIVFEGPDCAGKTTLISLIEKELVETGIQVSVLKRGRPERGAHPLVEYAEPITTHEPSRVLLCDRWHIGEEIYGPLYRDGSRLTPAMRVFIDGLLVSHGAMLVHVTARSSVIRSRFESRGEDYLRPKDVPQVVSKFNLHTIDGAAWRTIDTSSRPIDQMGDVVRSLINEATERAFQGANVHSIQCDYVGPRDPEALLVGDRPANDTVPSFGAFTPWHGNSAEYLFNALFDAKVLIRLTIPRIGWVNSHKTNLAALHLALGRPPVIALGSHARSVLENQEVPIRGTAYHPQYARRFRHAERAEYGDRIAQLINQ